MSTATTAHKKTLNRQKGDGGEKLAAKFLKRCGFTILHKNYATPLGEVDIIAHHVDIDKQGTLVFVEVKTRSSDELVASEGGEFGTPSEAVSHQKQQRITRAASQFLSKHQIRGANVRFDIVEVYLPSKHIEHLVNAFESYLNY